MDEKTIKKGSLINALGIVGKALLPLLFVVITRLFGPTVMGNFFLAFVILDFAFNFTMSGVKDGISLFTARHGADTPEGGTNNPSTILANAVVILLLISVVSIFLYYLIGKKIVLTYYPDGALDTALATMVWSIPLYSFPNLTAAAVRGLLLVQWEVILIHFLRPLLICIAALVVHFRKGGLPELALGYLYANLALFLVAIPIFQRHFHFPAVLRSIRRPFWNGKFIRFIIPQNLNATFNTLITNIDVLMLGFFRTDPALIGYYGMGAQIVRNIRQIKIAMAGIMGPVITKLHALGNIPEIERLFNKTSRWAITLALPGIFLVGLFHAELLQLFHKSFSGHAPFMLWLLIPPFLSCLMGMAGDIIVMTGHSAWNLINSASIAVLNMILNYFFIPIWKLEGAAIATVIATVIVYHLQLYAVHRLFAIHLKPATLRPLLYTLVPFLLFLVLERTGATVTAAGRIIAALTCAGAYFAGYLADRKHRPETKTPA